MLSIPSGSNDGVRGAATLIEAVFDFDIRLTYTRFHPYRDTYQVAESPSGRILALWMSFLWAIDEEVRILRDLELLSARRRRCA